jgi:hypothetical protein
VTTLAGYLDTRTQAFVDDVLDAIDGHVPLVAAYLLGSGAVGGFDPATSDVDVVVVVERPLGAERGPLVEHLRGIPCPLCWIDLVLYVDSAQPPNFELNLGDGDESACWFVLDAAVAQDHAVTLRGRPWSEHFEPIPEDRTRAAAREALAWSERHDDEFARVTAARARHYLEHGEWLSKAEAQS